MWTVSALILVLGILAIAVLFWIFVPHPHLPLESLREENQRRLDRKQPVLWVEKAWEEDGYIETPYGLTHYYMLGPEDGERLVFVHGITAGSPCFPQFLEGLAEQGFRICTYDLFGRGFSDSPGVHYNEGLYVTQLYFVVSKLKWERCHLVGLSLGGGIAASFASQFPELIETLSLIAPAGLLEALPPIAHVLQTPFIGPIVWHALGRKILVTLSESNYKTSKIDENVRRTMAMTAYMVKHHPGLMRAYYSTVKHFPICGLDHRFAKLEKLLPGRVGVVWGNRDTVVPFYLLQKFTYLVPSARVFVLKGEGHSVCVENPKVCIEAVKEIVDSYHK
jgi:pimeloyl-ACP methyl ester carboxylesterase